MPPCHQVIGNLLTHLLHQILRGVLDNHILQGKTGVTLFEEGAVLQRLQRFKQGRRGDRLDKIGAQHWHRDWFAFNRQPEQNLAFQGREAGKLLVQHQTHPIKELPFFLLESCHITAKEIGNGGGHNLQGQRVARIVFNELGSLGGGSVQPIALQQHQSRRLIQTSQRQHLEPPSHLRLPA